MNLKGLKLRDKISYNFFKLYIWWSKRRKIKTIDDLYFWEKFILFFKKPNISSAKLNLVTYVWLSKSIAGRTWRFEERILDGNGFLSIKTEQLNRWYL